MSNLSVSLLGSFGATLAERPLPPFRTKSVQALLIYLLCEANKAHQREALMTLLWPDMPLRRAQGNLRQTLFRLQRMIPEVTGKGADTAVPFLLTSRQTIQINPDADYFLDVAEFDAGDPAQAIALYRGDFLADFYLPGSETFEEWAASRRADYLRRALAMMERATAVHLQNASYDEAIQLAQRQLAIDNLRESSHRQLMEAWARNGRRQEALTQYNHLYQLLQDELAIEPDPQTEALIAAIRAGTIGGAPSLGTSWDSLLASLPKAPQHNLPPQTTQFIGREDELAHIADQFTNPACRLLTILGAGGMGKTRLGIAAAQAQVEHFADGVVYVSLASIGNEDAATATSEALKPSATLSPLVSALVDALKVPFQGSEPLETQLINYLRRKEMLLVFDNFEHLLATAVFLSDLLRHAPHIKILTTSRERLNLQEEWLLVLQGLSFVKEATAITSGELSAVQLFSQRAQQVKADFDWMREETAVLQICQLVEGMPLGLELAAAWVMHFSCQEITAEIEASLDFLQSEMRNIPDRHRNVRAIFGHSWEMLTAQEKDALRRLSVFRGGFDRTAAQAVAGASLPTLARLVSKSLLSVGENGRYAIHELLRQFAAEKLAQANDAVFETGRLHSRYFLAVLAEQGPKYSGPDFPEMVAVIERDLDNVRTAVQWAIQNKPHLFNHGNGLALRFFYDSVTLYLEGEIILGLIAAQLKKALPLNQSDVESGPVPPEVILWAEYNHYWGTMYLFLGRNFEADLIMQDSLLMLPAHDPATHSARAFCLASLGANAYYNGDLPQSMVYLKESAALFQAVGDTWGFAAAIWLQGESELALGNIDKAQQALEESEQLFNQIGSVKFRVRVLTHLSRLMLHKGEIAKAETYSETALTQQAHIGSIADITECLNWLGEAAYLKGDFRKAQAYHEQCLKMVTDVNLGLRISRSLLNLGNLAVAEGDFHLAKQYFDQADATVNMNQSYIGGPGWAALGLEEWVEARHYFEAGLRAMLEKGARQVGLDAVVGIAHLKRRDEQFSRAAALLALVRYHRASSWELQEKARKLWEALVDQLPLELITTAEAEGRALDLQQTAVSLLAEGNDE